MGMCGGGVVARPSVCAVKRDKVSQTEMHFTFRLAF